VYEAVIISVLTPIRDQAEHYIRAAAISDLLARPIGWRLRNLYAQACTLGAGHLAHPLLADMGVPQEIYG
jgi:hypothetical protein